MKTAFQILFVIMAIVLVAWIANIVKFTKCDFQSPYRCEVIHGIGIFPPAALVTVWFSIPEVKP